MARIVIVDEKDNVIGSKERDKVSSNDIYRVSALWLANSMGEILLAKRALTKSHSPGKWGPAVAGTVEEGETYESNIQKEAFEELGLSSLNLERSQKAAFLAKERKHKYFAQLFVANVDKKAGEFAVQKEEVAEVKWFSPQELRDAAKAHPENFLEIIKKWAKGEVRL